MPAELRRFAIARSLFSPTTLVQAIERLGFVQADPIRAPARAQDLTLRHRVDGYLAGDLERRYAELEIEEDVFINYGFLPRRHLALMHPRKKPWDATSKKRAARLLAIVKERGEVHPRDLEHLAMGTVKNYWGGSSNAATFLLDAMHYRGMLRVARREAGIRVYAPAPEREARKASAGALDELLRIVISKYAPVPSVSIGMLASRLRYAAPQLTREIPAALKRARASMPRTTVDGIDWYWPDEPMITEVPDRVRMLAPFDPVVWDRRRFELLWGWAYRFEAYTPVKKRKLGYYALPLLWRDDVVGWANVSGDDVELGYVRKPKERAFKQELEAEIERLREFMGRGTRRGR
jgi:hypothetical protein